MIKCGGVREDVNEIAVIHFAAHSNLEIGSLISTNSGTLYRQRYNRDTVQTNKIIERK